MAFVAGAPSRSRRLGSAANNVVGRAFTWASAAPVRGNRTSADATTRPTWSSPLAARASSWASRQPQGLRRGGHGRAAVRSLQPLTLPNDTSGRGLGARNRLASWSPCPPRPLRVTRCISWRNRQNGTLVTNRAGCGGSGRCEHHAPSARWSATNNSAASLAVISLGRAGPQGPQGEPTSNLDKEREAAPGCPRSSPPLTAPST